MGAKKIDGYAFKVISYDHADGRISLVVTKVPYSKHGEREVMLHRYASGFGSRRVPADQAATREEAITRWRDQLTKAREQAVRAIEQIDLKLAIGDKNIIDEKERA
jgi:hypothetical protein